MSRIRAKRSDWINSIRQNIAERIRARRAESKFVVVEISGRLTRDEGASRGNVSGRKKKREISREKEIDRDRERKR